ncbi:FAS1 domain-containing protein [Tricladium varicosporioides]|nr:FAS1 domain-containing protein [Hymenoscyphus varicosporioides]
MKGYKWKPVAATALGYLFATSNAQTGSLTDLGTLLSSQTNLSTFYGLIQKYPSILLSLPSIEGVTILAPNNDAFNKIPYTELNAAFQSNNKDIITSVMEYHILQGSRTAAQLVPGTPVFLSTLLNNPTYTNVTGGQKVENVKQAGDVVVFVSGKGSRSTVVQTDLKFTGGVVQVLDTLLIPPANLSDTTTTFNLTSFQGALYTANKLKSYTQTGNLTLFVPRNAAFQALGPAISNMTVEQLGSVLDYHVVTDGEIFSPSLKNGTTWNTQQGTKITVRHSGNNVYINSAQLLTSDILIANGVIHVIDNVLNPEGSGSVPNPQIENQPPVFASASSVTNLPFTTALPCTSSCPVTSSGSGTATAGSKATNSAKSSATVNSSSSKALGAAMARETGFGAAGLMMALGGAALII